MCRLEQCEMPSALWCHKLVHPAVCTTTTTTSPAAHHRRPAGSRRQPSRSPQAPQDTSDHRRELGRHQTSQGARRKIPASDGEQGVRQIIARFRDTITGSKRPRDITVGSRTQTGSGQASDRRRKLRTVNGNPSDHHR